MEIGTTMVRFQMPKEQMSQQTDKAVLLELFKVEATGELIKEWVPLSKIEFEESTENSDVYDVIMPKWLFYKKDVLPLYCNVKNEFVVTTYADKYELLAAARKQ